MSRVDKNKAVLQFLADCPVIKDNPLYFNFADAEDNRSQYITSSSDNTFTKPFIDGSKRKQFTFNLITFKSISDNALISTGTDGNTEIIGENMEDMFELQEIIDWVNEQAENQTFPDFGDKMIIDNMETTTEEPYFEGVDTGVSPALAMYSIAIRIDYIDYSKTIWS